MILSRKSSNRFAKLYLSFIRYADERLGASDGLLDRYSEPHDDEVVAVARAVWHHGTNTSLIADYVRENPDGLSRADLKEIEQWECGLSGIFTILIDGRDTLFNIPGYSIAVRGLGQEIGHMLAEEPPVFVTTVLLPFENTITYAFTMDTVPMDERDAQDIEPVADLATVKATSRMIRSARDLAKYIDELRANIPAGDDEAASKALDYDDLDSEHGPDDEIEGQHRGTLAGLSSKERLEAHHRAGNQNIDEHLEFVYGMYCHIAPKYTPAKSFREIYARQTKRELEGIARMRGIEGNLSSMSKDELLELVWADSLPSAKDALIYLHPRGIRSLAFARELQEAGGHIELTLQDVIERGDIAPEVSPVFRYYMIDGTLVAHMMEEYVTCLADLNWDEEVEITKRYQELRRYFETMTELRGVEALDEAIDEYLAYTAGEGDVPTKDELTEMAWNIGLDESAGFAAMKIDSETMLVDVGYEDSESGYIDREGIRDLMALQADKPKRPIAADMLKYNNYYDWVAQIAEVHKLIGYLDEHVPDTKSDLSFADDLMLQLLIDAPKPDFTPHFEAYLKNHDFFATQAQVDRFEELATSAIDNIPHWEHRGWSPNEMQQMIEKGTWAEPSERT